ncbi:DExH-box splicing factor binding site-domain-containing protein [Lophiotrema nucula]|uniref:Pre-mRNA-splicing factor n=1 Tax=Lophiotrema nucula TaxID=690887 RepID=A0A6A5YQH5_9PLEO|nr:DExH-box splicing factor binding site-domain-containing protein [Lophiotrema nucula]
MSAPKMGGFKLSLGGAKNKTAPNSSAAPPAKRAKLLGDDEVEDADKTVEITGFDTAQGGAIDVNAKKKEEEKPRIIPALPNRNWRAQAQAQRKQQAQTNGDNVGAHKDPEVKYGLTVMEKREPSPDKMEVDSKPAEPVDDGLTDEQREEKAALNALLNGDSADSRTIIPAQTEEEAFRQDYENAPEAPDLAAYEAVPIEGFGAALLRGMGWKDSDELGKNPTKPKEIKRRPALLGIGAKEEAAVGIELGEWGTGKGKNKKMGMSYNPVAIKIKSTGEIITEEEFKKRQEQKQLVDEKDKKSSRRDREKDDGRGKDRRGRDEEDYDSERKRDRKGKDEDYDSERRRDKKYRDDDYDSERRRDRKRRDEDNYDSERRRDKRKDNRSRGDDYKKERRHKDRRDRTRSPASDDSKKRKRRDYDDDSDRDDRRRKHRDERSSRR